MLKAKLFDSERYSTFWSIPCLGKFSFYRCNFNTFITNPSGAMNLFRRILSRLPASETISGQSSCIKYSSSCTRIVIIFSIAFHCALFYLIHPQVPLTDVFDSIRGAQRWEAGMRWYKNSTRMVLRQLSCYVSAVFMTLRFVGNTGRGSWVITYVRFIKCEAGSGKLRVTGVSLCGCWWERVKVFPSKSILAIGWKAHLLCGVDMMKVFCDGVKATISATKSMLRYSRRDSF